MLQKVTVAIQLGIKLAVLYGRVQNLSNNTEQSLFRKPYARGNLDNRRIICTAVLTASSDLFHPGTLT
jgi:hypothetical protein